MAGCEVRSCPGDLQPEARVAPKPGTSLLGRQDDARLACDALIVLYPPGALEIEHLFAKDGFVEIAISSDNLVVLGLCLSHDLTMLPPNIGWPSSIRSNQLSISTWSVMNQRGKKVVTVSLGNTTRSHRSALVRSSTSDSCDLDSVVRLAPRSAKIAV